MKLSEWLKPGIRVKRWIALGFSGIILIVLGLVLLFEEDNLRISVVLPSALLVIGGLIFIYLVVRFLAVTFLKTINESGTGFSVSSDKLTNLVSDKRIHIKGPKIVALGGGTGLSTMLRGLKLYSSNITAVVTVADDGGGSGVLRKDLGILPPGDIRNCILALADTEPIMEQLLQYRFPDGMLKGQSFGNLFLAAMNGISSNFEEAVKKMSDVLAVTGKVLPVTLDKVTLHAKLLNNTVITGQSNIGIRRNGENTGIDRVFIQPAGAKPLPEVIDAIREADAIVIGPGSLYTSIIPNLLVDGVSEAILASQAQKIYVCNIMTEPGETDGYTLSDHVKALEKHSGRGIVEHCIFNTGEIPNEIRKLYWEEGSEPVKADVEKLTRQGLKVTGGDILSIENNLVRHNSKKLAEMIISLISGNLLSNDKKRLFDCYYVKDHLRKIGM